MIDVSQSQTKYYKFVELRSVLITGNSSTVYVIRISSLEWAVISVDRST